MAYYAPGILIPSKLHLYQAETNKRNVLPFLSLPAEIRNRVYDWLFQPCLVEVTSGRLPKLPDEMPDLPLAELQKNWHRAGVSTSLGKQPLRSVQRDEDLKREPSDPTRPSFPKRRKPKKGNPARLQMRSQAVFFVGATRLGRSVHHYICFNFLFSNRRIYDEALGVMYNKITFRFAEDRVMDRFLSQTPARALRAIHALDVTHETFEEPELTADRNVKSLADRRWLRTCKLIRAKMASLRVLRLQLQLNDWPSQLTLEEEWARAILQLRGTKGLDRVDAKIAHFAFGEERLCEAALALEEAMMTSEGRIAKIEQARVNPKKQKKPALTTRVLVMKMT
jgi:hypothetical protein